MGGEGILRSAHGPYVGMVHFFNALYGKDNVFYTFAVYIVRNGIERHAEAMGEEAPGANEDDDENDETYSTIEPVEAGVLYEQAGDNHTEGYKSICNEVEVGTLGIEIVLLTAEEEHGAGEIDHYTYACHNSYCAAGYGLGMAEPVHSFIT